MLSCALAMAVLAQASPAMSAEFAISPSEKVVGNLTDYVLQPGDLLADVARHFDVGYTEVLAANPGVDPWVPPVGRKLTIPTLYVLPDAPRQGIVINLAERRLYYYPPHAGTVQTYPIGIGATGFDTPHSTTRVVRKEPNPVWIPPPSIHEENPDLPAMIGPGPDNPLGDFALRLGWTNYLIHGTNKPDGVGRNVSHGCIHLYPEDIEKLFNSVAVGTPVRVIEQPAAAAWMGIGLYVEAHPDKDQADQIDVEQPMTPTPIDGLRDLVNAAAGQYAQAVDWNAVDQAGTQRSGLPVQVAMRPPAGDISAAQPQQGPVSLAPSTEIAQYPQDTGWQSLTPPLGDGQPANDDDDEGPKRPVHHTRHKTSSTSYSR